MPALICVSGLGGTIEEWDEVARPLARQGELVRLQLPRAGVSSADGRDDDLLAAGRALVERELGLGASSSTVLVGHSMGGLAAMLAAAANPSRVCGLILTAPALPISRGGRSTLATAADYAHHRALFIIGSARRRRPLDPEAMTPAERAASLRSLARYARRPAAFHEDADRVRCPVLLVHGTRDHHVPSAFARAAAGRHPTWQLTLIAGAGHFPHRDVPDSWLDVVEPWLEALGQRTEAKVPPGHATPA